jgi:hypothetical protein
MVGRQLTPSGHWNKHVYTDVSPWNAAGTAVVYASGCEDVSQPARIVITGNDGSIHWPIADDAQFNLHTGAFQTWASDGSGIYYWSQGTTTFLHFSGEKRTVGPLIRHISPCNQFGSYREVYQPPQWTVGSGHDSCLWDLHADVGWVIAARADVEPLCPRVGERPFVMSNQVFSPDGSKILLGTSWGDMLCVIPRASWRPGTDIIYLGKAGHRSWHPDSERIVYVGRDGGTAGLWEMRWDGSGRRCITTDRDVYGTPGTHPAYSPDGQMIVSESYVPGAFGLFLLTPDGVGGRWIDTPSGSDHAKSHMHPCFSPSGQHIIYDSDQTGECQVYIAEVPLCVPS